MAARESQDLPRRIADLEGQDAYALLGIPPDADVDEIAVAYRREMARAHPDRGGSAHRAQAVNCAFDVLTRHRDDYDELTGRAPYPTGPDVLHVAPDVEPLDDVDPVHGRLRLRGLGLVAAGAALVAAVALAVVVVDRAARPSSPESAAWTTSGLGVASVPAGTSAVPVGSAPVGSAPGGSAPTPSVPGVSASPTAAPQSWTAPTPETIAATVVVASASATGADGAHRCEVHADGSLWCAGANAHGQLGDGSNRDAAAPVRVGADARWSAVATGAAATCGLHADGALWCWGDNSFGQLGDGTNSARSAPVPVEPDARWLALAVDTHACAVRADHTLWCWGAGRKGELGDGGDSGRVDRASPIRLGSEGVWASVSVGPGWTCGVRQDRSRQCWGEAARR